MMFAKKNSVNIIIYTWIINRKAKPLIEYKMNKKTSDKI